VTRRACIPLCGSFGTFWRGICGKQSIDQRPINNDKAGPIIAAA